MVKIPSLSVAICVLVSLQVNAMMPQVNYLGTVVGKDVENQRIEIEADYYQWTVGGTEWVPCSYILETEAPNSDAISGISIGDYVEASSPGTPGDCGDRWVSLAKLAVAMENAVSDIYGDSCYLLSKLEGDYSIVHEDIPDCLNCLICNCQTAYTEVTVAGQTGPLSTFQLEPGDSRTYEDEQYRIDIVFHSGEAYAYPACIEEICPPGPQTFSDFTLHILGTKPLWAAATVEETPIYGSVPHQESRISNSLAIFLVPVCVLISLRIWGRRDVGG